MQNCLITIYIYMSVVTAKTLSQVFGETALFLFSAKHVVGPKKPVVLLQGALNRGLNTLLSRDLASFWVINEARLLHSGSEMKNTHLGTGRIWDL